MAKIKEDSEESVESLKAKIAELEKEQKNYSAAIKQVVKESPRTLFMAGKKVFIEKEIKPDRLTVIRKQVEYHPGMCEICADDMLALNKVRFNSDKYNELSPEEKTTLSILLEKHTAAAHPFKRRRFMTEEDMNDPAFKERKAPVLSSDTEI